MNKKIRFFDKAIIAHRVTTFKRNLAREVYFENGKNDVEETFLNSAPEIYVKNNTCKLCGNLI